MNRLQIKPKEIGPMFIMGRSSEDKMKIKIRMNNVSPVRTWIQAYDVLKYVDPNGISYNAEALEKEIRGLYEAKVGDGYITWLSNSNLEKYKLQKDAYASCRCLLCCCYRSCIYDDRWR